MSNVLAFHPVSKHLAISKRSVTELLEKHGELSTFVLVFNQEEEEKPVEFEIGSIACSPLESYNHTDEEVEGACAFVTFPPKLQKLQPPYAKGTKMHVLIGRSNMNYFELTFKIGNVRSPQFAIHSAPGRDFIAVRTPDIKHVLAGDIDFKNMEEYLTAFHGHGPQENKCFACRRRAAVIVFQCKHAVFCRECDHMCRTSICPVCDETSRTAVLTRRSLYCMVCPHKECTAVGAFFEPCCCMVACLPKATRATHCPACDTPVEQVKQVIVL